MRYRLLGDLLSIKSALIYRRGYVDTTKGRNPVAQLNSTKTEQSDHTSFMEYNFKFKIDKGSYSSFNITDYLSDQTLKVLANDNEDITDVPSNLLMFQLSPDLSTRNYSLFEIYNSGDLTELILDLDYDIQKVEFYDRFVDYDFTYDEVKGYDVIKEVTEYNYNNPDPLAESPVMIVEFGPEVSYEPEDYYNTEEMPIKPEWDDEDERDYQMTLEEYTNKKFLTILTTSREGDIEVNLSLTAHKSQIDPHRNQESYVLQSKDFKSTLSEVGTTLDNLEESPLTIDVRSNTILGTESTSSDLLLLKDRMDQSDKMMEVDGKSYKIYKDYIVYNKDEEVYCKGQIFTSLIDGNLGENPYISPMWSLSSLIEDDELSEEDMVPHTVNIYVNDERYGITDPIGPTQVGYGRELYVKIYHESSNIKCILLDGVPQRIPTNDLFTLSEVVADHDLGFEFDPIYKKVTIIPNSVMAGRVSGAGDYLLNTKVTLSVDKIDPNFIFVGWFIDDELLSSESTYVIEKIKDDLTIHAIFDVRKMNVVIDSSVGGTFTPYNGKPSKFQESYTEYNSGFVINLIPTIGYEPDWVRVNKMKFIDYDKDYFVLDDIAEDKDVYIQYARFRPHVIDPVLGRINYVIIGDQMWSDRDLRYDKLGITNLGDYHLYNGIEMIRVDNLAADGATGFRVPTEEDWRTLYDYFDEREVGKELKSDSITRFNRYGWKDSIYRGRNEYRFNALPCGSYDSFLGIYDGLTTESYQWSSTINHETMSASAAMFTFDSPAGFMTHHKIENRYLGIRLMADCPRVAILGKSYRYIEVSTLVTVHVKDDNYIDTDDKYETHRITQKWILDNLDYTELGTRFENVECDKFGGLYDLDDVLAIDELASQEGHGFRVPTNLDYIYLEKYLGYGRDELIRESEGAPIEVDEDTYRVGYIGANEGSRMKAGDIIYSGIEWGGYPTYDYENSQLNVMPSGYAAINEDNEIEFRGMGTQAKFWTRSISDLDEVKMSVSRTISYDNDKILRSTDHGSKTLMSIRMVCTTDEIL